MNNKNSLSDEKLNKAAGGLTKESTLKENLPGLENDETETLKAYGDEHSRLQKAERDLTNKNANLNNELASAKNKEIAAQKEGNKFMTCLGF